MRFHVHGISRSTGVQTTLVVDAKHHEAAEAIAQRQLIVSEVVPEGGLAEPGVFDRNALDDAPTPAPTHAPAIQPSSRTRPHGKFIWIALAAILLAFLIVVLIWRRT
jgi:hypothetical protein